MPADRSDDLTSITYDPVPTIPALHTQEGYAGEVVTLTDVVAVLPRRPGNDQLLVQDPAGGEYAGLEVHLHHGFPTLEVAPGDVLQIRGRVQSSNGRMVILVYGIEDLQITGQTELEPSQPGPVADWEPYNGVLVAPGPAELLDCGETAGRVTTDLEAALDLTYVASPVVLGLGSTSEALQGVVHGFDEAWMLSPRTETELGSALPREGCPTIVSDARSADHTGRFVATDVVVTAVQPDGTRAFVQDPGGGPQSGLELSAPPGTLSHLSVSERISVGGLLSRPVGPLQLTVTHLAPDTREDTVTTDMLDDIPNAEWDGALVSLGPLEVTGSSATGRADTTAGIELVDVLLGDGALPDSGTWTIRGLLRVDERTDPPAVQLLPRSTDDWAPAD